MGKIASKEEEREALANIKQIVAGLGENSYIAIAMEGMWELIEENINDDFGNSHKDMIALRDDKIEQLDIELAEANARIKLMKSEINSHRERVDQLEKAVASDNETIEYLLKSRNDAEHKCDVAKADYETLSETSNHEIMRLKAKLYDYMTKEEEKEA